MKERNLFFNKSQIIIWMLSGKCPYEPCFLNMHIKKTRGKKRPEAQINKKKKMVVRGEKRLVILPGVFSIFVFVEELC